VSIGSLATEPERQARHDPERPPAPRVDRDPQDPLRHPAAVVAEAIVERRDPGNVPDNVAAVSLLADAQKALKA